RGSLPRLPVQELLRMTGRLHGKIALVTGASKGIGAGIAKAMAAEGADIVVNFARDRAAAETIVNAVMRLGRRAIAVQADVAALDQVTRLFAEVRTAFGTIDIVVNNASIYSFASLADTTDAQVQTMICANLIGTIHV